MIGCWISQNPLPAFIGMCMWFCFFQFANMVKQISWALHVKTMLCFGGRNLIYRTFRHWVFAFVVTILFKRMAASIFKRYLVYRFVLFCFSVYIWFWSQRNASYIKRVETSSLLFSGEVRITYFSNRIVASGSAGPAVSVTATQRCPCSIYVVTDNI